jgi:hypothetical protein
MVFSFLLPAVKNVISIWSLIIALVSGILPAVGIGFNNMSKGIMSIALDLMSKDWLTWANSISMSPEILHRVASMAPGGMDTMTGIL